jgi:Ca2+-binding RTX toxin-like protein
MAKKHILKQDTSTTWNIDKANHVWVLDKSAEITVTDLDALEIAPTATGSEVFINGDISVTGIATGGIDIMAGNVDVTIGKSSRIDASDGLYGIQSNSVSADIFNHGVIKSDMFGIYDIGVTDIHNTGEIMGGRGIYAVEGGALIENSGRIEGSTYGILAGANGTEIVNKARGRIIGSEDGIEFADDGDSEITNRGLIRSNDNAITDLGGDLTLINRGEIVGDVLLGGGHDTFDTRGGSLVGVAVGGPGIDVYKVSGQIEILELPGGGYDTVFSTGDFALAGATERLILQGNKDTDGVGNDVDNSLHGNAGNNTISGLDGEDMLGGGKGNDILMGGSGDDEFAFFSGDRRDRITDFAMGEDRILVEFEGIDDFDDVLAHLSQHDDDVWLTIGNDRLVIENVVREELTELDFVTEVPN